MSDIIAKLHRDIKAEKTLRAVSQHQGFVMVSADDLRALIKSLDFARKRYRKRYDDYDVIDD